MARNYIFLEKIEIRRSYKDMRVTMNCIQPKIAWAPPILEKTLIEAVSENNLLDVQTLLNVKGVNSDEIGPAILMATNMGYSEIVEELVWIKNNNTGYHCGIRPGINTNDIRSALRIANINKENAVHKGVWTDIAYNLGWGLVQILEDRKRADN